MNVNELLTQFVSLHTDSRGLSDNIEMFKEHYLKGEIDLELSAYMDFLNAAEYHRKLMLALELEEKSKTTELTPFWAKFSAERIAIAKANIYARTTARQDLPRDRTRKFRERLTELGYSEIANGPLVDLISPY